jgi:hypothetical protein
MPFPCISKPLARWRRIIAFVVPSLVVRERVRGWLWTAFAVVVTAWGAALVLGQNVGFGTLTEGPSLHLSSGTALVVGALFGWWASAITADVWRRMPRSSHGPTRWLVRAFATTMILCGTALVAVGLFVPGLPRTASGLTGPIAAGFLFICFGLLLWSPERLIAFVLALVFIAGVASVLSGRPAGILISVCILLWMLSRSGGSDVLVWGQLPSMTSHSSW